MRKCVFTLCVDGYAPEITAVTLPYLRRYADKIGADFRVIAERRFPGWPAVYEKLQVHELGRDYDWSVYFDADVLVHPDLFDVTEHLSKDVVLHWSSDMAGNRWRYDDYFRRDGRHIGSGNWLAVASDWCLDLWRPLDDLSLEQAVASIHPTVRELNAGVRPEHLVDDYALSRNIARFGLKFRSFRDLQRGLGREGEDYFFHDYLLSREGKLSGIRAKVRAWGLEGPPPVQEVVYESPELGRRLNGEAVLVRS